MPIHHVLTGLLFIAVSITAGCGGGGGGGGGASVEPPEITAAVGDGEVRLRWGGDEGIEEYTLYHATEGGIQPANFGIWMSQHKGAVIRNVTTPHTVEGLDNGTEYFFVVTVTVGGQESSPSNEINAVPLRVSGKLNDTGMDLCADGSRNTFTCPVAGFPGQDGELGRDAAARAGTLTKMGAGAAGFDYTKIANNGSQLPASATHGNGPNDWACTRDNVTGLIWQVKGGPRDTLFAESNTYSWYQPHGPYMGIPGIRDGGICGGSLCDTYHFVKAVNARGLCGASDWRLPTMGELQSLIHHGRKWSAVDPDFLPYNSVILWSATPVAGFSGSAWTVAVNVGYDNIYHSRIGHYVKLVRGGK